MEVHDYYTSVVDWVGATGFGSVAIAEWSVFSPSRLALELSCAAVSISQSDRPELLSRVEFGAR